MNRSLWIRDLQWIAISLYISTHEILNISKSTRLKFNYVLCDSAVLTTTLIYKYRLQWVCVQHSHQTHTIRNMFDSYACSFTTKEKRGHIKEKNSKYLMFVHESYLFCDSCILLRKWKWSNSTSYENNKPEATVIHTSNLL